MARVLIIENDDGVSEVLRGMIEAGGHQVETAKNVLDAVIMAATRMPDIVLADIALEGGNGQVAALALRGLGFTGPVIVVTGGLVPLDDVLARYIGFAGVIQKPFSRGDELLRAIDAALKAEAA